MQIFLHLLPTPKGAEEKTKWHPEAAESPFTWNCFSFGLYSWNFYIFFSSSF